MGNPLTRPRRDGLVITALALSGMTASFMQTLLLPIQGELPELLGASREDTAWVITITLLVFAIFTPIAGRLGDMYGKRKITLFLLGSLIVGSILAALAPDVGTLIVARALQGPGMGVVPLGISILRDVLPRERLGSAIALVSATLGVGGALGLPLSAFVTQYADWHALFWMSAVLAGACAALVAAFVPPSTLRTGGTFDFVGAVGLAVGLVGVLLAVSRGNEWGWGSPAILGLLLGGIAVLIAWGWFELRQAQPLVDLRISARPAVLLTNLASVAMGFALFTSNVAFPQLLELPEEAGGLGLSILAASLVLMPSGLAMLVMSPLAGRIERRTGPKTLFVGGATIIAVMYLWSLLIEPQVWIILTVNTVIGIGIGLGYAAMPTLIMRAVPSSETGAANGLNSLMRSLGTTFAAAIVAAVIAQYTVEVDGAVVPSSEGFVWVFLLGFLAAAVCAALALFIPRPKAATGEHPSLPEGV